jgi:hypothetical protein
MDLYIMGSWCSVWRLGFGRCGGVKRSSIRYKDASARRIPKTDDGGSLSFRVNAATPRAARKPAPTGMH